MVVPRQREFQRDLRIINEALNELIERANATRSESDLADLEARDYDKVEDASMLRFLVDLRGEEATDKQLRDDLMTMLVAGHETTAAVLTWAAFCLSQVRGARPPPRPPPRPLRRPGLTARTHAGRAPRSSRSCARRWTPCSAAARG